MDGATVAVTTHLTEGRVLVQLNGAPFPNRRLGVMNAPNQMSPPGLRTDASGYLDLRLGAGEYQLFPSEAALDDDWSLTLAKFQWPLPEGQDSISLKSMLE